MISDQWVLTAAHCVQGKSASGLNIRLGISTTMNYYYLGNDKISQLPCTKLVYTILRELIYIYKIPLANNKKHVEIAKAINIIWFNPPFSNDVKINIPRNYKLHKNSTETRSRSVIDTHNQTSHSARSQTFALGIRKLCRT